MQKNSEILKAIAFVAVAIAIGIGFGWFASRPKTVTPTSVTTEAPTSKPVIAHASPSAKDNPAPADEPKEITMPNVTAPASADTPPMDWDEKIGNILVADTEIPDKCKDLIKLYPTFPEDGKIEAARHLCNLVADDDYTDLGKILTDPKVPAAVAENLLFDLFNRPNSLKLPLLLQVARTPGHPGAAKAREDLALFLEEDYGTDWGRWERASQEYLKNNPD